eukprot:TRINITY_DN8211_c0_g1_i1.p1 TRINITY_DN8211_c0_g1~~TRINITY_DN8211_c0_g1_i1.p1  ORF type:complete len:513 (-),score=83.62 TRINITY_DN8211_c0_g1_i1:56-1594(-)
MIVFWDIELLIGLKIKLENPEASPVVFCCNSTLESYFSVFHISYANQMREEYSVSKSLAVQLAKDPEASGIVSAQSSPKMSTASSLLDSSRLCLISVDIPSIMSGTLSVFQANANLNYKSCGMLFGAYNEKKQEIDLKESAYYRKQYQAIVEYKDESKGTYYCLVQGDMECKDLIFVSKSSSPGVNLSQVTDRGKIKDFLLHFIKSFAFKRGTKTDIEKDLYEYSFNNCLSIAMGKCYVNESADSNIIGAFHIQKGAAHFLAPYRGEKAIIRVEPNSTDFFFISCETKGEPPVIGYHRYIQKSKAKILKDIQSKAIVPIQKSEIAPGIFFTQYKHDCGILFEIFNSTKHMLFKGTHKLKLINLTLEEEGSDVNEIVTVIEPNNVVYKWTYVGNMFEKCAATAIHEVYLETYSKENASLSKEIMKTGTMTKIGKVGTIWTRMIEDHWCMYIKNDCKKTIHLTIEVKKSVNLKCAEGDIWDLFIKSGEGHLKRVQAKNIFNVSNCIWHASCKLE